MLDMRTIPWVFINSFIYLIFNNGCFFFIQKKEIPHEFLSHVTNLIALRKINCDIFLLHVLHFFDDKKFWKQKLVWCDTLRDWTSQCIKILVSETTEKVSTHAIDLSISPKYSKFSDKFYTSFSLHTRELNAPFSLRSYIHLPVNLTWSRWSSN